MSLRAFHIVFVAVSIALSALVVAWGIREYTASQSEGALVLSVLFLITGLLLVAYAARAFRKLGELS